MRHIGRCHGDVRWLLPLLVLGAWLVASAAVPGTASAHSRLTSVQPADGATIQDPVSTVRLGFSGTVRLPPDAVQVFAPDRSRVDEGTPTLTQAGSVVMQPVRVEAQGTYAVAYRLTSADGHTVTGSTTFDLGNAAGEAEAAGRRAAHTSGGLRWGFGAARFVLVLALLVAIGGGIFSTVISPGWKPQLVLAALLLALAAGAATFVLDAAIASGRGPAEVLGLSALQEEAARPYGRAALVTGALSILVFGAAALLRATEGAPSPFARTVTFLLFASLGASLSLAGHAIGETGSALRLPIDALHVLAAATWIGGLVQLSFMAPQASTSLRTIERFSNFALGAVALLLATGLYALWVELDGEVRQVLDSQYGRIVLAKVLLYVATMPLAAMNRSTYLPTMRERPGEAATLLRQYVARELFLLVVIVALTAWLIGTSPPG